MDRLQAAMLVNLSQRRAQMRAARWTAQEAAPAGLKRLTLIRRPHGLEVRVQVAWWAWLTLGLWNLWMARRLRTALEAEELVELHILRVRAWPWPFGRPHAARRTEHSAEPLRERAWFSPFGRPRRAGKTEQ